MAKFARREAKTRIRQRDWLTLVGEKIRREQVGTVPTFFSVRANKFAKWKTGLKQCDGTKLSKCVYCPVKVGFRLKVGGGGGEGGGGEGTFEIPVSDKTAASMI